jgi:hypothetical protein
MASPLDMGVHMQCGSEISGAGLSDSDYQHALNNCVKRKKARLQPALNREQRLREERAKCYLNDNCPGK